ncbi:MAG TPA: type II toxin-antitoxin system VapC family toxin [Steroidobacteraceae bacterium]|nr:type II toxin-antitoxin system VapC family toxin [Steroidobacteraceae bacterium]
MTVVLDASVILKWLLADPQRGRETDRATALMGAVAGGEIPILQPFHWLAEVIAVLARLSPDSVIEDALMLRAMEIPTSDEASVLRRASSIAVETGQHVFDTLYHAVALENDQAVLITADERYLERAHQYGCVVALAAWQQDKR